MTGSFTAGEALRHVATGKIVRAIQVDGDRVTVETPTEDQYTLNAREFEPAGLTTLELSVAFCHVMEGRQWGGWNEETAMEIA
jgi:hypothetical protein